MIQISDLKFSYSETNSGANRLVLDIPDFQVQAGEKVFLFGPSGSGKTTFLEILAGILQPQAGITKVVDRDLSRLTPSEKDQFRAQHMGIIFQQFNLIPYLNVKENIDLPFLFNEKSKDEFLQEKLLARLGLSEMQTKPVTKLSTGQQQRVAVARALSTRPQLIIADEPTSALDFDHREKFLTLLFELCDEQMATLIFVSHDRSIQKLFSRSHSLPDLNRVSL